MVAACQFHLTEFNLKTGLYLHRKLVLAHKVATLRFTHFDTVRRSHDRMHCDAVSSLTARRPLEGIKVVIGHAERHRRFGANGHFGATGNLARFLRLGKSRTGHGQKEQQDFAYHGFVSHSN